MIYCFDFSWPCIEMTKIQIASLSNVHVFRANARGPMPFAPGGFDVILQRLAPFTPKGVERGAKDQRALDLLRPGGHYVFAGWEDEYDGSCEVFLENGFARVQHHRWSYPYHFEDEEFTGGRMENGASRAAAEAQLSDAKREPDGLFRLRRKPSWLEASRQTPLRQGGCRHTSRGRRNQPLRTFIVLSTGSRNA